MKAKAFFGEKPSDKRTERTMGVRISAVPSFAKIAETLAPSKMISRNNFVPLPFPHRATWMAHQAKKPASSRSREMTIRPIKVIVGSQMIDQTAEMSWVWTTPKRRANAAPARALHPMPSPRGCHKTKIRVNTKMRIAVIKMAPFLMDP